MAETPQNLVSLHRAEWFWHLLAAVVSAVLLALAFPPVGWWPLAWIAFVPLLLMPTPRSLVQRFVTGYLFGYLFYAFSLQWLNEVGFGAGYLLALPCALFPMLWYLLYSAWGWHFKDKKTAVFPGGGMLFFKEEPLLLLTVLFVSCAWVAQEWLLSFVCTGFPWNRLGVSLYRHPFLISLAQFTGVTGLSFVIFLLNAVIAAEISRVIRSCITPQKRAFPAHIILGALAILVLFGANLSRPKMPAETENLRVLVIQGDIPQCREWSEEQFQLSLEVYDKLTREAVEQTPDVDLVVWPESALPVELDNQRYAVMRLKLLRDINVPLLTGAIQYRLPSRDASPDDVQVFNSAFLLNPDNRIVDYYDKIHIVPFGEFTPFGDTFPWLRDMIGMGRDLTPGKRFRLMPLPSGARAGVNICFEDVFPEFSRTFTHDGANLLMTVTNDAWYNRSAGAEQHFSQMVFRAVENRRPFLRVGNNSHSCLVAPNGIVLGKLPFERTWQAYDIPIGNWGMTFYTRHGEWFAHLCAIATAIALCALLWWNYQNHKRNLTAIQQPHKG